MQIYFQKQKIENNRHRVVMWVDTAIVDIAEGNRKQVTAADLCNHLIDTNWQYFQNEVYETLWAYQ